MDHDVVGEWLVLGSTDLCQCSPHPSIMQHSIMDIAHGKAKMDITDCMQDVDIGGSAAV